MVQWWIDTIGKFGPAIIAALVLLTTRGQNLWQNRIMIRAAQVEDQKFRLALFERRSEALEKVRFAGGQFWIEGAFNQDGAVAVIQALRIAELVFDDPENVAIERFLNQIWKWQSLNRRLRSYSSSSKPDAGARYQQVVDEISEFEEQLPNGFEPLLKQLKEATRVQSVPPIAVRSFSWPRHRAKTRL